MKVELKSITPKIEETIVEIARVSSSRTNKKENPEGLINYLITNKHWSPFEHGFLTFEIETSKAIGIQLLRHRSFTFQELSQRYQDVNIMGDIFEPVELRKQSKNNRQSSEEVSDFPMTFYANVYDGMGDSNYQGISSGKFEWGDPADFFIEGHLKLTHELYNRLIEIGVAREQARMILPMCTKTRIFMTGSVRSWVHFLSLRDDPHAQKEAQEIAKEIKKIFKNELPTISKALNF